jgi:hypothetical protein
MASKVDICNRALGAIGEDTIMELNEGTEPARQCAIHFDGARDFVLRQYPWSCAKATVELARLTDTPLVGFSYKYAMPADWLKTVKVSEDTAGTEPKHRRVGKTLETDAETIYLEYVRQIEDTTYFDSILIDAIAYYLASKIAYSLTQDETQAPKMLQLYMGALREAAKQDELDQNFDPEEPEDTFISARTC